MKAEYDMTPLASVVADNTPKELADALQAILLDSCVYYTDVASAAAPTAPMEATSSWCGNCS